MDDLAKKYNIQVVDVTPMMEKNDEYFSDQVHLTFEGTKPLAGFIAKEILR